MDLKDLIRFDPGVPPGSIVARHPDGRVDQFFVNDRSLISRPPIICLCGSTRFKAFFEYVNRSLTLSGVIVLAPGVFGHAGDPVSADEKADLDALHRSKILLADKVLVIDPGGYVGPSTQAEIAFATTHLRPVVHLGPILDEFPPPADRAIEVLEIVLNALDGSITADLDHVLRNARSFLDAHKEDPNA